MTRRDAGGWSWSNRAQLHKTKVPRRTTRKAEAATPPLLRRMVAATDTGTLLGLRDVAAMLNGFAIAARRSELRLLDWVNLPEVEEGLEADVYRSKVTKEQPIGIPYGSHSATCPVRALRAFSADQTLELLNRLQAQFGSQ